MDEAWRPVSLKEARILPGDVVKRCPVCYGRVTVMGVFTAEGHLTLSHRRSHDGCPLILKCYRGVPKRHPEAVE
ncbi:hypothetical protein [Bradyrhizobium sp. P5_C11_2]